ncbi:MAG TPA: AEC family transporter [Thermoleophilaceae bacterium]|nr:AEC family transporter [Thermoleophilaceae bacterium]
MGLIVVIAAILVASGAGAAVERRLGTSAEQAADRLLTAVLFAVLPFVVFFNVVGLEVTADLAGGLALAWIALLTAGGLAYHVGRRRWPAPVTGAVVVAALAANTGYLGYPLTAIFLGGDRLSEAVAYDIVVAVPMLVLVCFAVGAALGKEAGESARERARAFALRNPMLPAFALALVAPDQLAPEVLVELSQALVFAALPIGFFAVGVYLAAASPDRLAVPWPGEEITVAVIARIVVAPAILFLLALPVIDLPEPHLLLAAMPAGLNTLVVANAFGLDRRIAAGIIAWSTAVVLVVAAGLAVAGLA